MAKRRRINSVSVMGKPNSLPAVCGKSASHQSLAGLDRYRAKRLGLPIPASHVVDVPWGYKRDPENPDMFIPIDEALYLLYEGVLLLKRRYTLVAVAEWLNSHEIIDTLGVPEVDARSLANILRTRPPFPEIQLPLDERKRL